MKLKIMHENTSRIRLQTVPARMTPREADLLEAYLETLPMVRSAAVHERTAGVIVTYAGDRPGLLAALGAFSYEKAERDLGQLITHSSREISREYTGKLIDLVGFKLLRTVLFPAPLNAAYNVVSAIPYICRAARCLLRRQLRVEVLDGISVGLSLARGSFGTAGSVMFLLKLGELLEEWTHKKSVDDLARSMSLNVDRAWLKTPEGEVLTPLSQIEAGAQIALRMGAMVPLDGVIAEGEVMVNQASLTGESVPVPKRPGMTLYAGTVIEEGECALTVSAQNGESRYDKIVRMIEQSEKLRSSAEDRAAQMADHLVPYTLAGSALTYLFTRNLVRATSVLMVDFSCALKLAMPLSVLSAMREAGAARMTVKGGKYLEAMAEADTIVFDKTGTLTHACPTVEKVIPFGGRDENEMLRIAACLEEHFPHSMANAVVKAARDKGLDHEEMHSQVEYVVAHGIASLIGGQRVTIGSHHFTFEDESVTVDPADQALFDSLSPRYSRLYLAIGGTLAAVICIADPLRAEAPAVIAALRALGVRHMVMLTGDSRATAAAIAEEVGVDEFRAEVLPEDKAVFVEELRKQGRKVVMLGDGINDSPALSAASVGIAVSDGAAIAREIADITISADDLNQLVTLRRIAMALMKRINANYRFIIGFNGALIALGALGILAPSTSAMLHNASTLAISLRSMTNMLSE